MTTHRLERGVPISSADVRVVQVKEEQRIEGAFSDLQQLASLETGRVFLANEQLSLHALTTSHVLPGPDEWNLSLPSEWIFGRLPGSLLRGDRISLLLVPREEARKSDERHRDLEWTRERLEQLQIAFEEESQLQEIVVSYVKGTNNQEIASQDDRKKPSGNVSTIELIVSNVQKEQIRKHAMLGYRFLIVYR